MVMRRGMSFRVAALLGLVISTAGWARAPEARTMSPAPAASRGAPESDAGSVVAAVERALAEYSLERLTGPFGGSVPDWARDWVNRRGKNDLFDRQWHAQAVR